MNCVREWMRRKGVSVEDLALSAGVSSRTLYRILNGEVQPTADKLVRLSNATGLSVKKMAQEAAANATSEQPEVAS